MQSGSIQINGGRFTCFHPGGIHESAGWGKKTTQLSIAQLGPANVTAAPTATPTGVGILLLEETAAITPSPSSTATNTPTTSPTNTPSGNPTHAPSTTRSPTDPPTTAVPTQNSQRRQAEYIEVVDVKPMPPEDHHVTSQENLMARVAALEDSKAETTSWSWLSAGVLIGVIATVAFIRLERFRKQCKMR